jgi:sporulation protein YlmC with PRC-barrel domain
MKPKRIERIEPKLAAFCSVLLILAVKPLAGGADDPSYHSSARSKTMNSAACNRLGSVEKASKLLGQSVRTLQDEKLGKIDEMAVDVEAGQVVEVIISTGGMLQKKFLAVPPSALGCDPDHKVVRLSVDKERLKAAPEFDLTKWSECCQSNRVVEVYHYYGCEPYFITWTNSRAESPKAAAERAETKPPLVIRLGYLERASKVIGLPVQNRQDEKLGKVDDLIVDLAAGRIVAVVVSSGGFLGIGDHLSAAPPQAFSYRPDRDSLLLDVSKETLARAPHFKSSEWPDLSNPVYVTTVYEAYRVEPYFEAYARDADNTRRNVRDRQDAVTPLQQGNSAADLDTTARIRKTVLGEDGFSVNARNVKIITANGHVTLRGVVNSEREKTSIGEIAGRIAGSENVDNQLDVKKDGTNY